MSWTVVYASDQAHLIEIVKSILEENSVEFVVVDRMDSSYGTLVGSMIELHVRSEEFIKIKKLITEFEGG